MQNPYDTENRTEWFDPNALNPKTGTLGWVVSSQSGGSATVLWTVNGTTLHPARLRLFAKFLKNTVIRGSYGIFWASDVWNDLQFLVVGPNFYSSQTITSSSPNVSTINLSTMFPPGV